MSWNYRIVKQDIEQEIIKKYNLKDKSHYSIRQVHYKKDGTPHLWSSDPQSVGPSEDLMDLKENFELMQLALNKPVLYVKNNKLVEIDS